MEPNLLRDAGINDRARKVTLRGREVIVPLKFDEDGDPATFDKLIFKRLSLSELRFLSLWRAGSFKGEINGLAEKAGLAVERVERLIKKLACFREEDARVRALCEIPTSDWIAAKHVQNIYEGGTLEDSEHKSLQELAKIEGAYKNNVSLSVTQNVFNLPKLDPETELKLKTLAAQEAQIIQEAQVANS